MRTVQWTATTPLNVYRGHFIVGDSLSDIEIERQVKEAALNKLPLEFHSRCYSLNWKFDAAKQGAAR